MSDTEQATHGDAIGWLRALLTGTVVLVVGLAASVGSANAILTRATSLSRDVRAYLASVVFLTVVIVVAWALRRLQARGSI